MLTDMLLFAFLVFRPGRSTVNVMRSARRHHNKVPFDWFAMAASEQFARALSDLVKQIGL